MSKVEVILVVCVLAVLTAMAFSAIARIREAATQSQCKNNLKQLSIGCLASHDANNALPARRSG